MDGWQAKMWDAARERRKHSALDRVEKNSQINTEFIRANYYITYIWNSDLHVEMSLNDSFSIVPTGETISRNLTLSAFIFYFYFFLLLLVLLKRPPFTVV